MPWPVYSERLLASNNISGYVTWTCPVGKRAVVKTIVIDTGNVTSGFIVVSSGAATVYTHYVQAAKETPVLAVMGVVYGGEQLKIYTTGLGMACSCNGYIFDSPATAAVLPADDVWVVSEGPPPDDIPRSG